MHGAAGPGTARQFKVYGVPTQCTAARGKAQIGAARFLGGATHSLAMLGYALQGKVFRKARHVLLA